MKIALATDHAGFDDLQELKKHLAALGHSCHDFGPQQKIDDDDYPDYIRPAALAVASGEYERGIILGGSAEGEAMVANRVPGVRCAVFYGTAVARRPIDISGHTNRDPYEIVRLSRQHNDANMLSLAGRFLSLIEMKQAAEIWLKTTFSNEPRHIRRISKLEGK